ncbi:hypothetical protein M231_03174 [Tremella mesenterica]|uniref:Uncharacterized protein n=1 Tax=Tremella mesenterica TaxID=5217 RepID=A0A4Q1BNR0_TREME|nr:hypothetical protein M231_03174 [Tremella mesenterica]
MGTEPGQQPDNLDTLDAIVTPPLNFQSQDEALNWARRDAALEDGSTVDVLVTGLKARTLDPGSWVKAWVDEPERPIRLRKVLLIWGSQETDVRHSREIADRQVFLTLCAERFADPKSRLPIAILITDFILTPGDEAGESKDSIILNKLVESPLLILILRSLLLDTDCRSVLTCLALILSIIPLAPVQFSSHLPNLLVVLGRILCWNGWPPGELAYSGKPSITSAPTASPDLEWHIASSPNLLAGDDPAATKTEGEGIARQWLVVLYGLWPSNVLAFLRNPVDYLEGLGVKSVYAVQWADVWPPRYLAKRGEVILSDFAVHPHLMYFTLAQEREDERRWETYDTPQIVALCHLVAHSEARHPSRSDVFDESPVVDSQYLSTSILGHGGIPREKEESQQDTQKLKLDLLYSERLRKQYLSHIGRLHKSNLRFTSDEVEVHNFVNHIKEQDKTISTLTEELSHQKMEASMAHQKHTKWQERLRDQVAALRDEKRGWQTQVSQLSSALADVRVVAQKQKEELAVIKNE